jgi:HTH-type transcriptional regulator / antitoxin HigA
MQHFPILPPDPIDAIKFRMEQMGMTKSDLAKYLGSQSRVSEILSGKRKLTFKMAKSLYKGLKIPAEVLLA